MCPHALLLVLLSRWRTNNWRVYLVVSCHMDTMHIVLHRCVRGFDVVDNVDRCCLFYVYVDVDVDECSSLLEVWRQRESALQSRIVPIMRWITTPLLTHDWFVIFITFSNIIARINQSINLHHSCPWILAPNYSQSRLIACKLDASLTGTGINHYFHFHFHISRYNITFKFGS